VGAGIQRCYTKAKGVYIMKRLLLALSVFMLVAWLLFAGDQDGKSQTNPPAATGPSAGGALSVESPGAESNAGPGVVITPRVRGASPAPEGVIDRHASIRVDKQMVLVPVAVTTPTGTYVTGLDKDMFRVYENGVEQVIESFTSEDAPMSVGVVFDTSGSMGNKLQRSRQAVAEFMKSANPEDEFLLVQFNDQAELTVPFTPNTEEVQNRLMFVQSKGRTALLDGVYMAMNEMKKAHNPRKAILIISDGGDNSSRYTQSEVRNSVREADVQIYAIGIFEGLGARGRTPEEADGPDLLRDLAEQTGGRDFDVENIGEMPDVAAKIGLELRNQYVIGYSPKNKDRDGKFRRIQVKLVKTAGLGQITPRWRTGYYAPSQ
jgi:Ca-activated chloride channel family protein